MSTYTALEHERSSIESKPAQSGARSGQGPYPGSARAGRGRSKPAQGLPIDQPHPMAFVAYYRVSTQRQGASGLGLEAQRAAVHEFVQRQDGVLAAEFQEVESGRKVQRPQLRAALALCLQGGAVLLIAKLDRLARNVAFLSSLMDGDVEFTALDLPGANRFTLHIMAAVAEQEARATSERTKAALAAYKARGGKLGTPGTLTDAARVKAKAAINAQTAERYRHIGPLVLSLRASGLSLYAIAAKLNELRRELDTEWRAVQVSRVLRYAERGRVA